MLRFPSAHPYLAWLAMKQRFIYRVANWAGLFTNVFFLFFRAYALEACYLERTVIGGLTVTDIVTYAVLTQAFLMVAPQWGSIGVGASVRSGQIALELIRPVGYVGRQMAIRLGVSGYYLVMRCLPVLVVGWLCGLLHAPSDPAMVVVMAASLVVSAWIANLVLLCIELSSFWLESERGVRYLVTGAANILSGLVLPLAFFPAWALAVAEVLPFRYTLYLPVEIYLGKLQGVALLEALACQLGWAVGLWLLASLLFARGTRKLVIQGG